MVTIDRPAMLSRIAECAFGAPLMIEPARGVAMLEALEPLLTTRADAHDLIDAPVSSGYVLVSGVAIIPVQGALVRRGGFMNAACGVMSYNALTNALRDALADPSARAVLFDIDSSGGEVPGCFDLVDEIYTARGIKPIWAAANEAAFSAAYAIASACEVVALNRTAMVGSIGIITMHKDMSSADEKAGIKYTSIYAGSRKVDGNPHQPLDPEAQDIAQARVDTVYDLFCETVARNRDVTSDAIKATEAGVFMGEAAIAAGLADRLETFDETLLALSTAAMSGGASSVQGGRTMTYREPGKARADAGDDLPLMADASEIVEAVANASLPAGMAIEMIKARVSHEDLRAKINAAVAEIAMKAEAEAERQAGILAAVADARTANPLVPDNAASYIAMGLTPDQARGVVDQLRTAMQSPEIDSSHARPEKAPKSTATEIRDAMLAAMAAPFKRSV
jgi:signal peptide peptidase SppA